MAGGKKSGASAAKAETPAKRATTAGSSGTPAPAAASSPNNYVDAARRAPVGPPPPTRTHSPFLLIPLVLFFASLASVATYLHYKLPTPITHASSLASEAAGRGALFSEQNALEIIKKLSVDIGYRIVGTQEHIAAEDWLFSQVEQYKGTKSLGGDAGNVQVEVWRQIDDGAHRFDFMSSTVWKKYYSMSNIIVRISDGTDESKANSVLLNSHLDSTLPSPGAADDGAGVGIMMEILRILTSPGSNRKRLRNSVVLLFNNGEESLQDASHLYITSNHTTVPSVRSVINLEACGVSGPELLFQAASTEMIKAYGKSPYPYGTVLANDVFSSGIVLSDTDYRQFVEYGKVIGLDMAIVGNSYLYHTRKDLPEYIQPGVIQHFGENVLAIVDYLTTSPESLLPQVEPTPKAEAPIYFTLVGRFFVNIPARLFKGASMGLSAFTNFQIQSQTRADKHFGALKATTLAIVGTVASLLFALVATNGVAFIMTRVLDHSLSWFSHEWLPIPLYAPPATTAILATQWLIAKCVTKERRAYMERATLTGLLIVFMIALVCMNAFGIGSAYLFGLGSFAVLASIVVNDFALIGWSRIENKQVSINERVHPYTYFILTALPAVVGVEGLTSFLDLFTPLTGRTGEISPADHIIATIVAALTFLCLPFALPLSHRFGEQFLRRAILVGMSVSVASIAIYASPAMKPFDALHPRRLFTHQVHNITSGEWWMNLGGADPSPSRLFQSLADGLQGEFGVPDEKAYLQEMNKYNPDFDILYPVSDFITPWKFRLPTPDEEQVASDVSLTRWTDTSTPETNFYVRSHSEVIDINARTRKLTLEVYHPSIIWSVVAFDAEILAWDLPSTPPTGYRRHHIKEVSRYGQDTWSVELTLRVQESEVDDLVARQVYEAAQREERERSGESPPAWKRVASRLVGGAKEDPTAFSHLITTNATSGDVRTQYDSSPALRSRLLVDFSGIWGEAMFPQSERSKSEVVRGALGVKRFREMDAWLSQKWPEVDAMLLNVVAGVAVA